METLVTELLKYGTTPVLIVLASLVVVLIKKIDENAKKDEERSKELSLAINDQMEALESRFEARFSGADKRLDELTTKVACVERDYLPREEHYREFSGWRTEINGIKDLLISLFKERAV